MSRIFISYSSRDEVLARKIHASMSSAGLNPFLAGISIEPGSHWTDVIFEELEEAEWVFFLASEGSCHSPAVQQPGVKATLYRLFTENPDLEITEEELIAKYLSGRKPSSIRAWIGRVGLAVKSTV